MNLDPPKAGALLIGAGGAGAATMLALLLSDLQGPAGSAEAARLGALAFAFLLTVPLVLGAIALLREGSGAAPRARALATLGTLLWMTGVGADVFLPAMDPSLRTAFHALALAGGLAYAGGGLAARPLTKAQRRAARRGA